MRICDRCTAFYGICLWLQDIDLKEVKENILIILRTAHYIFFNAFKNIVSLICLIPDVLQIYFLGDEDQNHQA